MKTNYPYHLIMILSLLLLTYCKTEKEGIFTVTKEQGSVPHKEEEIVVNSINVKIDLSAMRSEKNGVIEVPIPNGKSITLLRKREEKDKNGRIAWYGIVDKDPGSLVVLSITNKAIAGKITNSKGQIYRITYIGNGIHQIAEIDASKFIEKEIDYIEIQVPQEPEIERDCPDAGTQIDVMVVYTADAETGAGGAEGMEAVIYESIYLSNLSYQNSNVTQRVNLVHFEEVSYTETGNENTDLTALSTDGDGLMDNVITLRETYGADLVVLLTETMGGCGLAYTQSTTPTSGFAPFAYSVVKRSCAADNLSFPHEMGHNMGAKHDCTASPNNDINHGIFVSVPSDGSGNSWRTVMSYANCSAGPCTRIPYFSNPLLNYSPTASSSTDPLGTVAVAGTCTSDNTTIFNNSSSTVANFRCGSPSIDNVWMRDTWNDTGLEPDPATASESMWKSPYIWIRNSQDPTFLHQHEHENPITGQPNWVYVKMHNGGAAANGDLEVYYADASVSLSWPASWTLLSSVAVSLNASSFKIVEFTWNSLPGAGHYCLVARWNSPGDPMAFSETSDITYNTRQNNNIIWRNVNIVDMDSDEMIEAFNVENLGDQPFNIEFNDEALFPKSAFIKSGKIYLTLDKTLLEAWKKGGSKGKGMKITGNEIEITEIPASLDNIMINKKENARVNLRFVKNKDTVSDKYNFTVKQLLQSKEGTNGNLSKKEIGGVSYEIYTYRK